MCVEDLRNGSHLTASRSPNGDTDWQVDLHLALLAEPRSVVRTGGVRTVVFPCGVIYDADIDRIRLYDGAADTCTAVATCSLSDFLQWLKAPEAQSV